MVFELHSLNHMPKSDIPEQGEVRLFYNENNFNSYRGLVEVWLAGGWGRVNEDAWTIEDGEVVCRQLGFGGKNDVCDYSLKDLCVCQNLGRCIDSFLGWHGHPQTAKKMNSKVLARY